VDTISIKFDRLMYRKAQQQGVNMPFALSVAATTAAAPVSGRFPIMQTRHSEATR